ncbi:MAG: hypothetical protein GXO94_09145 [Nitrospirae bacterium]|nr:hypothetical protein [Nitrospirota bacterium]
MKGGYQLVNLVSVIVIVIFGNLLAQRYVVTADLTEAGIYSLSPATEKLVSELDDTVTVKVVFSREIPYPYSVRTRYALDMLNDYRMLSRGKIRLDVISSEDAAELERAARIYGIPPVRVNVMENDQIRIKRVYMGVAFVHGDRIENIPVISDVSQLEYQISSILKGLLRERKKTVAFSGGGGGDEKSYSRLKELLGDGYEVKTVELRDDELADADLLLIAGPGEKLGDDEVRAVDQFILRGGKVLFLLDRVSADLQYGFGRAVETGLEDLLSSYGIELKPVLVYDLSAGMVNVKERRGGFVFTAVAPYPFFPRITGLSRESMVTRNIEAVTLGFASPIGIENREGIETTVLARTSDRSGVLNAPFYVAVDRRFKEKDFSGPPRPVAVVVSGKFRSLFSDKGKDEDGDLVKEGESRLIVIADSDFASDDFIGLTENAQFVLNAVDWLSEDDTLISIRAKRIESRPVRDLSPALQKAVRYSSVAVPPLLAVLTGLGIWVYRKGRRVRL